LRLDACKSTACAIRLDMLEEVETNIAAVEALYEPVVTGRASPLRGGAKLWAQFDSAATSYRDGKPAVITALIERVNELAVARLILNDPALEGEVHYEPDIILDGRRIDFVIFGASENTPISIERSQINDKHRVIGSIRISRNAECRKCDVIWWNKNR
jgi:hypothetical protein